MHDDLVAGGCCQHKAVQTGNVQSFLCQLIGGEQDAGLPGFHAGEGVNYMLDTGLTFAVDEPAKVGRDRIADAAAAAEHYPLPCMTVDLGTATTYNVISDKKVFLGGFIVPGVQTSLRAISAGTAQLPPIAPEPPEHFT